MHGSPGPTHVHLNKPRQNTCSHPQGTHLHWLLHIMGSRAFFPGHTVLSSTSTTALCQIKVLMLANCAIHVFASPQAERLQGYWAGNCQSCRSHTALGTPPLLGCLWNHPGQDIPSGGEVVLQWLCLCSPLQLAAGTGAVL